MALSCLNFVPLPAPMLLTPGWPYRAATGFTGNIIDTDGFWGTGGAGAGGISSGPLLAYSDAIARGGTNPDSFNWAQGSFGNGSADPTVNFPSQINTSFFNGLDVQVTATPPGGASYRMLPAFPEVFHTIVEGTHGSIQVAGFALATVFTLDVPCKISKIWWYSSPGDVDGQAALLLPDSCQVWDVATTGMTVNHGTPNWLNPDGTAASPGNRWCYSDFTADNVTLLAGKQYKVSVYSAGGDRWRVAPVNFFQSPGYAAPGLGQNGIKVGPLNFPSNANGAPGQITFSGPNLPLQYPNQVDGEAENDFVDIEVIPV